MALRPFLTEASKPSGPRAAIRGAHAEVRPTSGAPLPATPWQFLQDRSNKAASAGGDGSARSA